MCNKFLLQNVHSGDVADVFGGRVLASGTPVGAYPYMNGGDNQTWSRDPETGRVSSSIDRGQWALLITEGTRLVLSKDNFSPFQVLDENMLIFEHLALAQKGKKLTVDRLDKNDNRQKWLIIDYEEWELREGAHPATSCHLTYRVKHRGDFRGRDWEVRCKVKVWQAADCTYFCMIQWSPAGYAGIQQLEGGKRVALFSMWHLDDHDCFVEPVGEVDDGVTVGPFGGEGEGFKSMRPLGWNVENPVECVVSGEVVDRTTDRLKWRVKCHFSMDDLKYDMATYERWSPDDKEVFDPDGFVSFVEDWDRSPGACGHDRTRKASFYGQKVLIGQKLWEVDGVDYSKVEKGCDAFAKDKVKNGICECTGGYYLSTGGKE